MKYYTEQLEPDKYYHIYNHAVGKLNLFINNDNYDFFLKKYSQHISPVADTFAYCLMPNHFHFAVRIKSGSSISSLTKFQNFVKVRHRSIEFFVSKQFSNLFSSYSQSFNKQQNRRGSLFERPFKRLHIIDDKYFRSIIHYIHYNPVHHGFVDDLRNWKYSSFESFFSDKATQLKREEVINWFDNKENFYEFHKKEIDEKLILELE